MTQRHKIQLFEDKKVRTAWDDEREEWYFSIVDVCAVLSESENPQTYWRVLKNRLKKEGNETVTNCNALKMLAPDGKMRLTDVASTEQLFRLIQSIPSKKAEPFKQWMAQVARERLDQMADPELAIDQAIQDWRRKGYSENWINNRVKSIEVRKALTDEWDRAGVQQGQQYASLTECPCGQERRQCGQGRPRQAGAAAGPLRHLALQGGGLLATSRGCTGAAGRGG